MSLQSGQYEKQFFGANTWEYDTAAAGADVDILSALPTVGSYACVYQVTCGFDSDPAAGAYLAITDDDAGSPGTELFRIPITKGGPAPLIINLRNPTVDNKLHVYLAGDGASAVGYVNCVFGEER
jgi:hypothetical protein